MEFDSKRDLESAMGVALTGAECGAIPNEVAVSLPRCDGSSAYAAECLLLRGSHTFSTWCAGSQSEARRESAAARGAPSRPLNVLRPEPELFQDDVKHARIVVVGLRDCPLHHACIRQATMPL